MNNSAFQPSPADTAALEPAFAEVRRRLGQLNYPSPSVLVGDVLYALSYPYPKKVAGETPYFEFMHRLTGSRRWQHLAGLVGRRKPQKEAVEARQRVLIFLTELLCDRLMRILLSGAKTPPAHPDELLPLLKEQYEEALEGRDYARRLLDDYPFVMVGLVRRAQSLDHLDAAVDIPLVQTCLGVRWDPHTYEPRRLRVITLLGDEDEVLPGDYWGIRGVTKKIREDQIPKILPSEFAAWDWCPPRGRLVTLDKVMNGSPPCYQHFDTRRPEIKHRILLCFVVAAEERTFGLEPGRAAANDDPTNATPLQADLLAKPLAFDFLLNAALKVPHERIEADVAWFEQRGGRFLGSSFPLRTLAVTRSQDDSWRNAVEVDRVLPHFFARYQAALKRALTPNVTVLKEEPRDFLARALAVGLYQAVLVVTVARDGDLKSYLPPPAVSLPLFDRETPTVLAACAEDSRAGLRGDGFRDLLAAHLAPLPLAQAEAPALVRELMKMIIGAMEQTQVLPTLPVEESSE